MLTIFLELVDFRNTYFYYSISSRNYTTGFKPTASFGAQKEKKRGTLKFMKHRMQVEKFLLRSKTDRAGH